MLVIDILVRLESILDYAGIASERSDCKVLNLVLLYGVILS